MIDRKFRLARKWSNETLKKYSAIFQGDIVNVSAWKDYDKCGQYYKTYFDNADSYFITNYGSGSMGTSEDNNEISLDLEQALSIDLLEKFNVVFNHTTLEHIYDFQLAFKNLCLLATDAVIVVVPFSQIQHIGDNYKDYWRFTPFAMERMFTQNEYTMVVCEHNDNFNAATYLFCIGINNKNLYKYNDLFKKFEADKQNNYPGEEIGSTLKSFIKRKIRK